MPEKWLPVIGYEDAYEVSDRGRVRSVPRKDTQGRNWQGKPLRAATDKDGRKRVGLSQGSSVRVRLVHVLVLEAHRCPRPDGMEGCHNDGNPANNIIENLRWDTHSGNMMDRTHHGTHYQRDKIFCPSGHPLEAPNLEAFRAKKGQRICLACARARATVQRLTKRGLEGDFQAIADSHLQKILAIK